MRVYVELLRVRRFWEIHYDKLSVANRLIINFANTKQNPKSYNYKQCERDF